MSYSYVEDRPLDETLILMVHGEAVAAFNTCQEACKGVAKLKGLTLETYHDRHAGTWEIMEYNGRTAASMVRVHADSEGSAWQRYWQLLTNNGHQSPTQGYALLTLAEVTAWMKRPPGNLLTREKFPSLVEE